MMFATHDLFTHQMADRLKTTCMALGLVRLLQDAKRFDEARTTLHALENNFQGVALPERTQKTCKANPVNAAIKAASRSALPAQPSSLA